MLHLHCTKPIQIPNHHQHFVKPTKTWFYGHSCLAFFLPATWSFSPSVRPHGLIMIWAANCRPGSHSANAVAASGHGGSMGTYTSGTKSQWPEQAATECPFLTLS